MKTTKRSILLALLPLLGAMLTQTKLNAQESIYKPAKYEIAMDLKGFFSEGYPEKVLFKINNIKQNQIVGAYRLGVIMYHHNLSYNVTQNSIDYNETSNLNSSEFGVNFGYEIQKTIRNAVIYGGADFGTVVSIANEEHEDQPGDSKSFGISLTPFTGVKVFLSKALALSFEIGLENAYFFHNYQSGNNPDNRVKFQSFGSTLKIPYTFSLNFNF